MNTLTVVAHESYEDFAENLQQEIEEETGIRFGVVEEHQFASIVAGEGELMGVRKSQEVWRHLHGKGYLDGQRMITDSLRAALNDGDVSLPTEFEAVRSAIIESGRQDTHQGR